MMVNRGCRSNHVGCLPAVDDINLDFDQLWLGSGQRYETANSSLRTTVRRLTKRSSHRYRPIFHSVELLSISASLEHYLVCSPLVQPAGASRQAGLSSLTH